MTARWAWLSLLALGCASAAPPPSGSAPGAARPEAPPKPAPPPDDPAFAASAPATLAVGEGFACALVHPGAEGTTVACWGDNRRGQLGQGDLEERVGAVIVPALDQAVEIGAGSAHACARRRDGTVWCWGEGADFLLGSALPSGPQRPRRVPAIAHAIALGVGAAHSCAVIRGGSLRCWGSPDDGRLGLDHLDHVTEPANVALAVERVTGVAVGEHSSCVRDGSGHVHCWGIGPRNDANRRTTVEGVAAAVDIVPAYYQSCARTKPGKVLCWGDEGKAGPIEDLPAEVVAQASAIAFGDMFGCALGGGGVTCWGSGRALAPEYPGYRESDEPVAYEALRGATEVRARSENVCARAAGGDVLCWGDNGQGQLGRAPGGVYPKAVLVPFAGPALGLDAVAGQSCAIGKDGKLRCWGDGWWYGAPTSVRAELDGVKALSLGASHACAVHGAGQVACWGRGGAAYGELGKGPAPKPPEGVLAPSMLAFGGGPDFVAKVEGVAAALAVAVGDSASCALTGAGVWCWGDDGAGRTAQPMGFGGGPCSAYSRDQAACDALLEPRLIAGSKGATAILGGEQGFCMLRGDGTVACWRDGSPAEIAGVRGAVSLHRGTDALCALDGQGALHCWGPDGDATASDAFAEPLRDWSGGAGFECAVTRSGGVLCRGDGSAGQLGHGARGEAFDQAVAVAGLAGAVAVRLGSAHACALLGSGEVWCWGAGDAQMARLPDTLPSSQEPVRVALPIPDG